MPVASNVKAQMVRTEIPASHPVLGAIFKIDLRALADGLLQPEPWIVDRCVEFVVAETQGLWRRRAREMMCRRLKHCSLGRTYQTELVSCIPLGWNGRCNALRRKVRWKRWRVR